ncbi:MAG TPA: hypothetical protein VFX15_05825 [Actinomycetes bacterium]|nr:hypothetical protein [Actinomycetes bacterium]
MNWPAGPELNALIRQRELYERFLVGMLPDRDWTQVDDVEAGARAWACLYQMVLEQCRTSRVAIVPMETFGASPDATIEFLFGVTGLESQEPVPRLADEYARRSGVVTPQHGEKHELHRDSRALSVAWHGRLDKAEVNAVRALTDPVYSEFYRGWDRAEGELGLRGVLPEGNVKRPHV